MSKQKRCAGLERENDELQAENEQLKKLVLDMWSAYVEKPAEWYIDYSLEERMNKLGIGVEE